MLKITFIPFAAAMSIAFTICSLDGGACGSALKLMLPYGRMQLKPASRNISSCAGISELPKIPSGMNGCPSTSIRPEASSVTFEPFPRRTFSGNTREKRIFFFAVSRIMNSISQFPCTDSGMLNSICAPAFSRCENFAEGRFICTA